MRKKIYSWEDGSYLEPSAKKQWGDIYYSKYPRGHMDHLGIHYKFNDALREFNNYPEIVEKLLLSKIKSI